MSEILLLKETRNIIKQIQLDKEVQGLECTLLRVLQMRHKDLDLQQARRVLESALH